MLPEAGAALDCLLEGNERFRVGKPRQYGYTLDALRRLAGEQRPNAAVVSIQ